MRKCLLFPTMLPLLSHFHTEVLETVLKKVSVKKVSSVRQSRTIPRQVRLKTHTPARAHVRIRKRLMLRQSSPSFNVCYKNSELLQVHERVHACFDNILLRVLEGSLFKVGPGQPETSCCFNLLELKCVEICDMESVGEVEDVFRVFVFLI